MARWCSDRGLVTKGHPLCWHQVAPKWHTEKSLDEMRRLQMERIRREVGRFAGLIDMWDVVNEAVVMPSFDREPNHMSPLVNRHGVVPILAEAFAAAREAGPRAALVLNDYDHTEKYERLIADCLEAGLPIDVIGLQSHMHRGYVGGDAIWEVCERFARFGKPLHWTEATIISGEIKDPLNYSGRYEGWTTTPEGEARQADEVADFYTTLYAHPAVEAITWWDFRDGCWLGAPAGLVREDMSPKPAYERLMGLMKGEWWSCERTLVTDETGSFEFTGTLGDYEITAGGLKASFAHDGSPEGRVALASAGH
jgi:GH35 family endo-1,4-beta-xylanase